MNKFGYSLVYCYYNDAIDFIDSIIDPTIKRYIKSNFLSISSKYKVKHARLCGWNFNDKSEIIGDISAVIEINKRLITIDVIYLDNTFSSSEDQCSSSSGDKYSSSSSSSGDKINNIHNSPMIIAELINGLKSSTKICLQSDRKGNKPSFESTILKYLNELLELRNIIPRPDLILFDAKVNNYQRDNYIISESKYVEILPLAIASFKYYLQSQYIHASFQHDYKTVDNVDQLYKNNFGTRLTQICLSYSNKGKNSSSESKSLCTYPVNMVPNINIVPMINVVPLVNVIDISKSEENETLKRKHIVSSMEGTYRLKKCKYAYDSKNINSDEVNKWIIYLNYCGFFEDGKTPTIDSIFIGKTPSIREKLNNQRFGTDELCVYNLEYIDLENRAHNIVYINYYPDNQNEHGIVWIDDVPAFIIRNSETILSNNFRYDQLLKEVTDFAYIRHILHLIIDKHRSSDTIVRESDSSNNMSASRIFDNNIMNYKSVIEMINSRHMIEINRIISKARKIYNRELKIWKHEASILIKQEIQSAKIQADKKEKDEYFRLINEKELCNRRSDSILNSKNNDGYKSYITKQKYIDNEENILNIETADRIYQINKIGVTSDIANVSETGLVNVVYYILEKEVLVPIQYGKLFTLTVTFKNDTEIGNKIIFYTWNPTNKIVNCGNKPIYYDETYYHLYHTQLNLGLYSQGNGIYLNLTSKCNNL